MVSSNDSFIFVIDTKEYSGNFERELCAFVTGCVGECGVGDNCAAEYLKAHKQLDFIDSVPDDNGCYRPCSIIETPGVYNNGYGFHYTDGQEKEARISYEASLKEHHLNGMSRAYLKRWESGDQADLKRVGWTLEALEKCCKEDDDKYEKALSDPLPKYPAYQSVSIFLTRKPTDDEIAFMKSRCEKFNDRECKSEFRNSTITITGYRLICNYVTLTSTSI